MFRRHPILCTLATLATLAVIAAGAFIATFDLNRYREQLQARMSAALLRPVHLGHAAFTLRHGPAFSFTDLRIEEHGGEADFVRADHLLLKLELLPLLRREIIFSEILLEAPRLTITLQPATPGDKGLLPAAEGGKFDDTLIRALTVRNGTLHLLDRRDPSRPYALALEQLDAKIADISSERPGRLHLAGMLVQDGIRSPLSLDGQIRANRERPTLRDLEVDLELLLGRFAPEPLLRHLSGSRLLQTQGAVSLQLQLKGSASGGLRLGAKIDGTDLQLHFPSLSRQPMMFRQYQFQTTWTDLGSRQHFAGLALHADDLALAGELFIEPRGGEPWIEGEVTSGHIPLLRLSPFLPDDAETAAGRLRRSIGGGWLEVETARFRGLLANFNRLDASFPLKEAKLGVHDGVLRLERGGPLLGIDFALSLEQDRLEVRSGKGLFLGAPLRFSATVLKPFGPGREMKLIAGATPPLQSLVRVLPIQWPEKMKAEGPLPLELNAGGEGGRLLLDLRADLKGVALHWGEQVVKPAGEPGSLFLTGALTPDRLEVSHGWLQVRPFELRSRAEIDLSKEKTFHLALDLAPLPLERALPFLPSLDRFALRGSVSGNLDLTGSHGKINQRTGTLYLRNFGMHLGGAVADISDASGQLQLREDGIESEDLSAKLGVSPVRISGSLRNFSDPHIDLHVRAKTIRARELIFPSEKAMLRDVDGKLTIDRSGILFSPVRLHLSGGTSVSVRGAMKSFSAPQVTLEIEADKADIDEVIDLWNGPARTSPYEKPPAAAGKDSISVLIDARVREGILGPLHFQNAQGRIGFADGRLVIFPLRFHAGKGHCTGEVELVRQAGGTSLLKVSGHLENFDAEALHHELFRFRGLVSGTLGGDFYLEGEPGRGFLASSMGGASLQISDGVLRKFPFLSKVFSLLNVSQLLTFKLPDMAQEGMPFNRLNGNFSLRRGVLSTEDLFVDSNAMNLSLVGNADLARQKLDFVLGIKPLRTVDKIVTRIPIAGWLLTGNEKALITAHFEIKGKSEDPDVKAIPITSVSDKVLGIFKRVLGLPGKVVSDMGNLIQGEKKTPGGGQKGR